MNVNDCGTCPHVCLQIPLAMAILTNTKYYSNRAVAHDTFSSTVMAISAGYFLYDSIECIVNYASEGPAFVVHGVACGSVYITLLHTGVLHWFGECSQGRARRDTSACAGRVQ